jgi:hypothetical protein
MIGALVVSLGNHGSTSVISGPLANARIALPLVPREAVGAHTRAVQWLSDRDPIHEDLHSRGVLDQSSGYFDGEGKALTVSNQVDFAAESASQAAQSVVWGGFELALETVFEAPAAAREALTFEPSMQKGSELLLQSRSRRICKAWKILSHVPSWRHVLKYCYTVCQGPYRSGTSLYGAPVRRIQSTPLSISRGSCRGRPVRARFWVTNGATRFYCSSVNSCRCTIGRYPPLWKIYRQNVGFSDRARERGMDLY